MIVTVITRLLDVPYQASDLFRFSLYCGENTSQRAEVDGRNQAQLVMLAKQLIPMLLHRN